MMVENYTRPPLRYPGAKHRLSKWVVGHFPSQIKSFVDLFAGGGGVWHCLPRYHMETAVEIDSEITNFFHVLRTRTSELLHLINWTAFSDGELALARQPCDDSLEQARRTFVRSWLEIGGTSKETCGFRIQKNINNRANIPAKRDLIDIDHLYQVAGRWQGVQIINGSAFDVLPKFLNQPSTLLYADPPYLLEVRKRQYYKNELEKAGQHARLSVFLKWHNGPVVVSGKPTLWYKRFYEDAGWQRVDKMSRSQSGRRDQCESLWLNPICVDMLSNERGLQMKLI